MPRPRRSSSASSDVVLPSAATEAFAKVEPLLAAIPAESLVGADADVLRAVSVVLAALPKLRELRPAIVDQLPKFPVAKLDDLERYALAAWYANLLANTPREPGDAKALTDEATSLREDLLVAADPLAHRALIDKDALAAVRKHHDKNDLANDLVALSTLYRSAWDKVRGKTTVEERDVDRAAELAPQLLALHAATKHGHGKAATGDTLAERRTRAFTLLVQTFDELRRAVTYVRWVEHDVDAYLPALVKSTRGRKPGKKNAATDEAATDDEAKADADDSAEEADDAVPEV